MTDYGVPFDEQQDKSPIDVMFESMVGELQSIDDLGKLQMAKAFVDNLDKRRKAANKHYKEVCKAFERQISAANDIVVELLQKQGTKTKTGAKYTGLLGTTFIRETKWKIELEEEAKLLDHFFQNQQSRSDAFAVGFVVQQPHVTEAGKDFLKQKAEKGFTGDLLDRPPFVKSWTPPGLATSTRLKDLDMRDINERVADRILKNRELRSIADSNDPKDDLDFEFTL